MAQADGVVANGTGAAVRSDLNGQLAALFTNHSGSTEPGTTYAYQWWADTNANVLKIRNSSNDGWITLRELDGTMLIEDGSAASPGLSFASDLDTGFFRSASNRLNFATGGTERLELGSSEAVFNDPSDDYDFRVESNNSTHMLFVDAGNDCIGIKTSTPNSYDGNSNDLVIANTGGNAGLTIATSTSGDGTISWADGTSGDARYRGSIGYNHTNDKFTISTAASSAITIDSSGRLLVGTSTATDNTRLDQKLAIVSNSGNAGGIRLTQNPGANAVAAPIIDLRKTRGSTDGSHTIVADGDALGYIVFGGADGTDNESQAALITAQVDGTPGANDLPGVLIFQTTASGASSTTERVRINNAGQVGIGTNDPQQFVHVSDAGSSNVVRVRIQQESSNTSTNGGGVLELGGTRSDGTYGQYGAVKGGRRNSASDNKGYLAFFSDNGDGDSIDERVRITHGSSNGADIRLNCTDDPTSSSKGSSIKPNGVSGNYYLSFASGTGAFSHAEFGNGNGVVGSIVTTGSATAFNTSSDYRLKENLVDLDGAITRVKQLAPKRFNFIADDSTTVDGFLAHEAQTVVPEAVTGAHNAVKVWQEGEELPDGVSVGDNKLDEDGNTIPDYQSIDQSKLVPLLTAALQEAIAKIETLETKVAALEAG